MHIKLDLDFDLPRWAKRTLVYVGVPSVILCGVSAVVYADAVVIPYTFADGQTLSAEAMNDNFGAVRSAVEEASPPGSVTAFAGPTIPNGWLLCDGRAVNRQQYLELFQAIGIAHGGGDGTSTFNLPDYRGRFLRGVDDGAARDPERATRLAPQQGVAGVTGGPGNAGDAVGSVQTDALQGHWHTGLAGVWGVSLYAGTGWQSGSGKFGFLQGEVDSTATRTPAVGMSSDGQHNEPRTAAESRPVNAYINYIIRH